MATQPRGWRGSAAPVAEDVLARAARLGITEEAVLREYARIGFSNILRIACWDDKGKMATKPIDLEGDDAPAIAEIVASASSREIYRIKMHDKKPVLDALGRYLGMFGAGSHDQLDGDDTEQALVRQFAERATARASARSVDCNDRGGEPTGEAGA